jgi:hypothetical protein
LYTKFKILWYNESRSQIFLKLVSEYVVQK